MGIEMTRVSCRCFFAAWPDQAVADRLHLLATDARGNCGGRVMRCDTLHITLVFLGEIPAGRVADARKLADELVLEPFDLTLDRLGYWRHNRILWAGGVSPRLTFLAETLGQALRAADFALDARPFVPHLTLLRDARCVAVPPLPEAVTWPVREFVLAESRQSRDGPRYDIVARWPLA